VDPYPALAELLPILTRELAAEVADRLTLDVHAHRHRVVRIVVLEYEASFDTPILAVLRTRAADRLKAGLRVRRYGTYRGLLAGYTCPTSNGGPNGIRTRV